MSTGDIPKRHHFVPETYLRAWCDVDGRVAVRRRDRDKTFLTNPVNVGVEARLYGDGHRGSLAGEQLPARRARVAAPAE